MWSDWLHSHGRGPSLKSEDRGVGAACERSKRDPECGACGDGFVAGAELRDGASDAASCSDGGFVGSAAVGCTEACVPDFAGCTMTVDNPYCCAEEWDARCVGDVERLACAQCADG